MSSAWVAGVVRAKALARRRLGAQGARALASSPGMTAALTTLAATPYGHDVTTAQTLPEAQRAVGAVFLWNMRVLAGWMPREGAGLVRLLATGYEIANVDEHLAALAGAPTRPGYALGSLETAWSRLSTETSLEGVSAVLAASSWRLRGVRSRREIQLGLRLGWAASVARHLPEAAPWARSAAALLLLREVLLEGRSIPAPLVARATDVLGPSFVEILSGADPRLDLLRASLAIDARAALGGLRDPADLWLAEAAWWHRTERDGFVLLRGAQYGPGPVVGALAVLAVDAWRVRAALATAARGDERAPLEAFDALA